MDRFNELRDKYSTFVYKDYSIEIVEGKCLVKYLFEIPGLTEFHPSWEFPVYRDYDKDILERLVFSLGMVEAISYY